MQGAEDNELGTGHMPKKFAVTHKKNLKRSGISVGRTTFPKSGRSNAVKRKTERYILQILNRQIQMVLL